MTSVPEARGVAHLQPRHPEPTEHDLRLVLDAVQALPEIPSEAPLPDAVALVTEPMTGWKKLAESQQSGSLPAEVSNLIQARIDELGRLEAQIPALVAGTALVHLDLLGRNVLIDAQNHVTFTGWQFAARGSRIFDAVSYLFDEAGRMPHSVLDSVAATHPVLASATPGDVDALLAGLTGWSLWTREVEAARLQWGIAGLNWLATRCGW